VRRQRLTPFKFHAMCGVCGVGCCYIRQHRGLLQRQRRASMLLPHAGVFCTNQLFVTVLRRTLRRICNSRTKIWKEGPSPRNRLKCLVTDPCRCTKSRQRALTCTTTTKHTKLVPPRHRRIMQNVEWTKPRLPRISCTLLQSTAVMHR
jgi:hypothetical protein